jgi:hypothetical protein
MTDLEAVVQQLREERARVESELANLNRAILVLESTGDGKSPLRRSGHRTMSPQARKRIADAQRRRWARVRARASGERSKRKKPLSPEARRRISAAQKARWAKFRAGKKK